MRHTKQSSGFLLTFLLNLILNFEGALPGLILLGLHIWLDWPLWLVWLAFGIWVGVILIGSLLVVWAAGCSDKTIIPPPENKNPYSAKNPVPPAQDGRVCPACGAQAAAGTNFCPMCGAPLSGDDAARE